MRLFIATALIVVGFIFGYITGFTHKCEGVQNPQSNCDASTSGNNSPAICNSTGPVTITNEKAEQP